MWKGILAAFPIILGYFPYGFTFGILARQVGLSLGETVGMSLIVYAGASQIIVLGMIQAGQSMLAMVLATFLVNLRYFLLCAALTPYLSSWSVFRRSLFAYQVSDETFAFHTVQFQKETPRADYAFSLNMTAYFFWALFSFLGFVTGELVPDIKVWGLDFALPAMFLGLLLYLIQGRTMVAISVLSSLLVLLFHEAGFKTGAVIITTILGSTLGATVELWKKNQLS